MQNNEKKVKNSKARIKANDRYNKANYKNISIRVKPDQADEIRATAEKLHQSLAQLIVNAVRAYADIQTAGAGGADPAQPEQDPTESPMESGETAGAQPEEEKEEDQTAGEEEEPQEDEDEDEDEDEKPEDIPAFVWEQIQRLKKADKRHTAERKAREAAERKRRRIGESGEDY